MPITKNIARINDLNGNFIKDFIESGKKIFGEDMLRSVESCVQCGCCTGGCPSSRRTALRTRKLFREMFLGFKESVLGGDDLWLCTTCYTCYERCPRGVKTTDIIKVLRNMAVRQGYMAEAHRMTASYVFKTGHGVPANEEVQKLRVELGLDSLPPTTHSYPEALKSVQEILKLTGFDEIVGFDWKTMELRRKE
ncbi:MAG TPA: CoB--CoM heterodisulfide reductase subunit C [Candidatus Methanoperedenaceae archaeon]|nr:CoB--CoM heterodisulfide reductase subunit C [Candidatus Methanoperedenaceae archaeon]